MRPLSKSKTPTTLSEGSKLSEPFCLLAKSCWPNLSEWLCSCAWLGPVFSSYHQGCVGVYLCCCCCCACVVVCACACVASIIQVNTRSQPSPPKKNPDYRNSGISVQFGPQTSHTNLAEIFDVNLMRDNLLVSLSKLPKSCLPECVTSDLCLLRDAACAI